MLLAETCATLLSGAGGSSGARRRVLALAVTQQLALGPGPHDRRCHPRPGTFAVSLSARLLRPAQAGTRWSHDTATT